MVVFLGRDAWSHIATFEGTWNPEAAAAWSVWAAFSVLAGIGLFHPLRMLPIVLLEITYKTIWLIAVGFPLLSAGTLDGRAEEMMFSFGLVVLPIIATPWGYVFRTYLRRDDKVRHWMSSARALRSSERTNWRRSSIREGVHL
jgi:hypothetical protein